MYAAHDPQPSSLSPPPVLTRSLSHSHSLTHTLSLSHTHTLSLARSRSGARALSLSLCGRNILKMNDTACFAIMYPTHIMSMRVYMVATVCGRARDGERDRESTRARARKRACEREIVRERERERPVGGKQKRLKLLLPCKELGTDAAQVLKPLHTCLLHFWNGLCNAPPLCDPTCMQDGYNGHVQPCWKMGLVRCAMKSRQYEPGATETVSPPPKRVAPGGAGIEGRPFFPKKLFRDPPHSLRFIIPLQFFHLSGYDLRLKCLRFQKNPASSKLRRHELDRRPGGVKMT